MSIIKGIKERERKRMESHPPAKSGPKVFESPEDIAALAKALDVHIVESRDNSRNIEDDGFHPSSLGIKQGKCARRAVYLLQGVAKDSNFDARLLRIFAVGTSVHERLQENLEGMGINMRSEVKVESEDPPIRGHADGLLEWKGVTYALEIKSCSTSVFEQRVMWKKPKDEHIEQVNIYAHVLGVDNILVVYENKNNQELLFFGVETNHDKAQKQIDKWHAQYLCFKDGELPKRPYKPASPTCAVCDLKDHCFADSNVGVELKPYTDKVKLLREEEKAEDF